MRVAVLSALVLFSFAAVAQDSMISIQGNVMKPGTYPVDSTSGPTLRIMIGRAGGLTPGWLSVAYIYRTDQAGNVHKVAVPLRKILNRAAPDITLNAGDEIYIPGFGAKSLAPPVIDDRIRFPE